MRDHAADKAPIERGRRVDHITGIEQFSRARFADDARQDPGAAIAGDDAQLEEGHAKLCLVGSNSDVSQAGEIAAKPDRGAVDRCDQGHAQAVKRAQHLVDVVAIAVRNLGRIAAEGAAAILHRLDIAARAEGAARTGQDHAAHVHVEIHCVASGGKGIAIALGAERVHRLRTVKRKCGDVAGCFDLQE